MRSWFAVVLGVAGCMVRGDVYVHQVPINPSPRAMEPRAPESVELFTGAPPRRDYVEVAYFEGMQEGASYYDDADRIFAALRGRAAAMGCDAILITGSNNLVDGG